MIQNNKAIIVKIKNVRKHCNADRLNCTDIFGYNIIVGLEVKVGDIGLYFPEGVQLSTEFCEANNLVRKKDENGNVTGGMFEESRRVKTLKLRKEKSEGFFIPLSSLSSFGDISTLKENDCLDVFGGKEICRKYVSEATLRRSKGQVQAKPENFMMCRHVETSHLRQNLTSINVGDILYVSEKWEGTSFRCGKILEQIKLPKWKSYLYSFVNIFIPVNLFKWTDSHGSRNVVLGDECDPLRKSIRDTFIGKLYNGESVYGECVGYDGLAAIRPPVDNSKISKEFVAQFGEKTHWNYGCKPGQHRLAVYRITQTSTDGSCVELSWPQVKRRCGELGVDNVNELCRPIVFDGDAEKLNNLIETLSDGKSEIDHHWKEGAVVRVESTTGKTYFLKHKNFTYKLLEGIVKEKTVDEEDAS